MSSSEMPLAPFSPSSELSFGEGADGGAGSDCGLGWMMEVVVVVGVEVEVGGAEELGMEDLELSKDIRYWNP